ncbi:MAG TPA: methyltransferase domain-containing protein [Solirubrobacteraceae bacterium]|nr:methyltransferase domain-containing protein [Solirubrobacteraceae bacterium]
MHERLLNYLRCPACGGRFGLETFTAEPTNGHREIVSGLLLCEAGNHGYPVVRGVPRLLPDAFDMFGTEVAQFPLADATPEAVAHLRNARAGDAQAYDRRTRESFSNEWEQHEVGDRTWGYDLDKRVETYFLRSVGFAPAQLEGMLMLDAGCGNGSQSVAYTRFGLEVIAVDLSSGLEHGYAFRHRYPGARPESVHFVQADLQSPVLEPSSVDIIHSAGVLHHTPDTERTFRGLCPLVRPGGTFYVWLYKHERFVTRPVNTLRALSTRVPPATFARVARVLADPFRVFTRVLNALGLRRYPRLSRREAALALMDIFGAPHAHAHTYEEVVGWMRSEGFDEVWPCNETRRGFGACGRRASPVSAVAVADGDDVVRHA